MLTHKHTQTNPYRIIIIIIIITIDIIIIITIAIIVTPGYEEERQPALMTELATAGGPPPRHQLHI